MPRREALGETSLAYTLILDFQLQDCERTHFSVVFVMAALANYHRDIRLFTFKTGPL